ncbi:alpha/beta fold hydrolase [Cellulosimicrobium sp. PMB13]|uniref:alpha/beta fold hydrolase n=1 Tax=Cellulosimicrobium sp. PMB13 TaxID=3120158 RepID=UPI003F4B6A49
MPTRTSSWIPTQDEADGRFTVGDLTAVAHVSGPPDPEVVVVLVHGVGSSARAFSPVVDELARRDDVRAAVHALDLPGFGAAPRTGRDVPLEEHAAVVAAYVRDRVLAVLPDDAPAPPVVLVGHSMGGQIVGQAMADHPREAPAGVLVGPTADRRARTAPRHGLRLLRDGFGERPRALGTLAVDYVLRCTLPYYARQVRRMLGHRLEEVLPRVPGRVVVLRGRDDPIAPHAWARELAETAPHGELREVTGRHHAMDSDPGALVDAVLAAARDVGQVAR